MKFIHLSDLHLGKRIMDRSMIEDQRYILGEILDIIVGEKPDAVFIAGDIYDKAVPSAEAVGLFDEFLVKLAELETQVFVISGNHDSPERIAFGGRLMDRSGVHLSPVYDGKVRRTVIEDCYGKINIFMLPFIRPAAVRSLLPERETVTYTDAVSAAIQEMHVNEEERNILITHQFVTGAVICDSEEHSVGGSDNVAASVFSPFDYVALGHIHSPQWVSRESIRYCGTPLKYSLSELKHQKSVTVVNMGEKGSVAISTVPLTPMRDMYSIKGTFDELMSAGAADDDARRGGYMYITLTDEENIPDAIGRLRTLYSNILRIDYDNSRTRLAEGAVQAVQRKNSLEYFEEFFEQRNGRTMSQQQREFVISLLQELEDDRQ